MNQSKTILRKNMELEKHKILVYGIEEFGQNFANALHHESYHIQYSSGIAEAFSFLIEDSFDLVLLLNFNNETETIKICKIIKSNQSFQHLPVIFISHQTSRNLIIDAYDAGANDFLEHSVDMSEIKDKIEIKLLLKEKMDASIPGFRENQKKQKHIAYEILTLKHELITKSQDVMKPNVEIALSEVEKIKSVFLKIITQELRSPMSAIIGFTDIIKYDEAGEDHDMVIDSLARASRKSKELLDIALAITEIDAEKTSINFRPYKVSDLFEYAIKDHSNLIEEKEINIVLPAQREITEVVIDPALIKEVVRILIHSALQHSPAKGEIVLDVIEAIDRIELRIANSGERLKGDELNKITNFFKCKAIPERSKWPGLRFAIVKFLMGMHHGEISIENNTGGGVTTKLIFPVNNSQREALHQLLSQLN